MAPNGVMAGSGIVGMGDVTVVAAIEAPDARLNGDCGTVLAFCEARDRTGLEAMVTDGIGVGVADVMAALVSGPGWSWTSEFVTVDPSTGDTSWTGVGDLLAYRQTPLGRPC